MAGSKHIYKYPRTHHIHGSRFQEGDEELDDVPLRTLEGKHLIIEEKVDGANAGISYGPNWDLRLQSRGHYLQGGRRELQFDLFKQWSNFYIDELAPALGDRYVLYGEWTYAKHTVFYDALPHYFLEFDIFDTQEDYFLSTPRRRELLEYVPSVHSVPLIAQGTLKEIGGSLEALIGPSTLKSQTWKESFSVACKERGRDPREIMEQTDWSDLMEGLYIKVEDEERVLERYKFVRADFVQIINRSEEHWLDRPMIKNRLAPGAQLF